MKSSPLVSVLINNYNYGRFLREAIDSALNQTYPHVEVVVVDDGSTDGSQEIIKSYGDRIIPILKENGGQASAFNVGVEQSKGDFLFFLDSDDTFSPEKISRLVNLFQQVTSENANIAICNGLEIINDRSEHLRTELINHSCEWKSLHRVKRLKEFQGQTLTQISTATEVYSYAKKYRYIPFLGAPTSGVALTRSLAEQIFPLTCHLIKVRADDFVVKAASLLGDMYFAEDALTQYRVHGSNNWFGNKRADSQDFLHAMDTFLNAKLESSQREPILDYFNSIHAQVYYRNHFGTFSACSKELLMLATKVMTWSPNQRTIKFFAKVMMLFVLNKTGFDRHFSALKL
ncbi:glycosyltransferase family 2 protein [Oculatella sp. FACHB-28]|uniref:glycosyltransferase family 2 protein n=1 Tax=Cyanophyceae TaxID=3028117 RepID=UPI001685656F|nr:MULTISPECIES: glycosyltransferase family A protein [Cyanophyceae]MBD2056613.1 glycosyltransferase family 2 protein [Oculatella sp. FACHB-28]MBD2070604.1 glycosyltransferase family 2 protein [Leptolyngbya sp. FACHB-671]